MTIKDLADFTEKNETTVMRWVKKAKLQNADLKLQNAGFGTYGHNYSLDEVKVILESSTLSKDAVHILILRLKVRLKFLNPLRWKYFRRNREYGKV